jgi:hypothetical protein
MFLVIKNGQIKFCHHSLLPSAIEAGWEIVNGSGQFDCSETGREWLRDRGMEAMMLREDAFYIP